MLYIYTYIHTYKILHNSFVPVHTPSTNSYPSEQTQLKLPSKSVQVPPPHIPKLHSSTSESKEQQVWRISDDPPGHSHFFTNVIRCSAYFVGRFCLSDGQTSCVKIMTTCSALVLWIRNLFQLSSHPEVKVLQKDHYFLYYLPNVPHLQMAHYECLKKNNRESKIVTVITYHISKNTKISP